MREIKFRAKRKFDGTIGSDLEWVYSSLLRLDYEHERLNLKGVECKFETLGEFTGLKDKNGREIYEGDIVKSKYVDYLTYISFEMFDHDENSYGVGFVHMRNGVVECNMINTGEHLEVIGNIHENPELLKAEGS